MLLENLRGWGRSLCEAKHGIRNTYIAEKGYLRSNIFVVLFRVDEVLEWNSWWFFFFYPTLLYFCRLYYFVLYGLFPKDFTGITLLVVTESYLGSFDHTNHSRWDPFLIPWFFLILTNRIEIEPMNLLTNWMDPFVHNVGRISFTELQ